METPAREADRLTQIFTSHFAPPDLIIHSHPQLCSRTPTVVVSLPSLTFPQMDQEAFTPQPSFPQLITLTQPPTSAVILWEHTS